MNPHVRRTAVSDGTPAILYGRGGMLNHLEFCLTNVPSSVKFSIQDCEIELCELPDSPSFTVTLNLPTVYFVYNEMSVTVVGASGDVNAHFSWYVGPQIGKDEIQSWTFKDYKYLFSRGTVRFLSKNGKRIQNRDGSVQNYMLTDN